MGRYVDIFWAAPFILFAQPWAQPFDCVNDTTTESLPFYCCGFCLHWCVAQLDDASRCQAANRQHRSSFAWGSARIPTLEPALPNPVLIVYVIQIKGVKNKRFGF